MKFSKLLILASIILISSQNTFHNNADTIEAQTNEYTYIESDWQYYSQSDTNVNINFKRTPYIKDIVPSTPSTYYNKAEGLTGSSLKTSLKNILSNPTTSYDWSRYEYVDEDPNNSNNVFLVYARASYGKSDHVSGNTPYKWNREHTYPQSKLAGGADKDSHLIFADDWKTNGIRGNLMFGNVNHISSNLVKDSDNNPTANYYSGNYFEPTDAAKGEVARSTLYTYTLYDEPIEDNFQSISLLLEWHLHYPVTSWEILRNNRNYEKQGNRNPFIDHPEYACAMLENTDSNTKNTCQNTTPIPFQKDEYDDVQNVIELINKIGEVTLDSELSITTAENAYNSLDQSQKDRVTNYSKLVEARDTYNSLLANANNNAKIVIDLINNIGDITIDSLASIVTAENAYNNLTEFEKNLVTNYQLLIKARDEYNKLIYDQSVIDVINLINQIGTVTLESKNSIETAEKAYQALTTQQKEQVSNYQILLEARKTYNALINEDNIYGEYIFEFYNENKITSTSGTTLSLSHFINAESTNKGDIVSSLTLTGTVQYDKNGGLTLGSGSNIGTINLKTEAPISKIEIYGTLYDTTSSIKINNQLGIGQLSSKGTKLESIETPSLTFELDNPTSDLQISTTSKRATIYTLIFYVKISVLDNLISLVSNANTCVDYVYVNDYMSIYNSLSIEDKNTFAQITDTNGVYLYDKLIYMQEYYNYQNELNKNDNNIIFSEENLHNISPYFLIILLGITILIVPLIIQTKNKYKEH